MSLEYLVHQTFLIFFQRFEIKFKHKYFVYQAEFRVLSYTESNY